MNLQTPLEQSKFSTSLSRGNRFLFRPIPGGLIQESMAQVRFQRGAGRRGRLGDVGGRRMAGLLMSRSRAFWDSPSGFLAFSNTLKNISTGLGAVRVGGACLWNPFPLFSGRVVFPRASFFVFLVSRQTFGTVDFPSPFLQLIRFPPLG